MLVEEVDLVRGALAAFLTHEDDLHVAACVPPGAQVVTMGRAHRPAVIIMDIDRTGGDGWNCVFRLTSELPESRLMLLAGRQAEVTLRRALAAGVWAVLSPETPPDQLVRWIRQVAAGERVVDPAVVAAALTPEDNPLTERERAVLRLVAEGEPLRDVAARLFLAPGTVRNYLSAAKRKIGARNRLEAVRRAQQAGWL